MNYLFWEEGIIKKTMKKTLILGANGFIGSNITKYLVKRGNRNVTAVDINDNSSLKELNEFENFKLIIADFTKIESFNLLDSHYDEVYHLAAIVGVNRTLQHPEDVIKTNTLLTMNTLDWISRNSIGKIVFASSSENYAGTTDLFNIKIPTDETVPLCISDIKHPRWTYAISKIHGESAFLHSSKALNYKCSIVRYQNIIGPNMGFNHAIPHIVERFYFKEKESSPFKIYGHDQTRAFCYIEDAIIGTVALMEKDCNGEIFHIGNDQEVTIEELTIFIGSLMNYNGLYEPAKTYPGSVSRRCPNISKSKSMLNYSPLYSWKKAVELTVQWYHEFYTNGNKSTSGGFIPPEQTLL
jgi:UDP-glucose 4-epimerase